MAPNVIQAPDPVIAAAILAALPAAHERINAAVFGGQLSAATLEMSHSASPEAPASSYGRSAGQSTITLHPALLASADLEIISALLLHEMCHQAVTELAGLPHAMHGPRFIAECNRVAATLREQGLPIGTITTIPEALTWPFQARNLDGPPRIEREAA